MQPDGIRVFFLEEGAQAATDVAARLADFIHAAQHTLDIAIYDFRLSDPQRDIITKALAERAAEGVQIRIAYDADKPAEPHAMGVDPAPSGTGSFVQSLGYPWRRIGGMKLMHNKYLVRDAGTLAGAVWTGSLNFTDDAWTLQENNVLQLASANLTALYAEDFAELWDNGTISHTGDFDTPPVALAYAGQPAGVQVMFSPGRGQTIDYLIALRVAQAQRHVRICSMLLNSGALLSALGDLLHTGRVSVDGIYDRTQMDGVLYQWQDVPHNHWKIRAFQDIVQAAHLVGKNSTPYSPTSRHDFMHDKILVVDDYVITGSYNFSRSAELNAENVLIIHSPALAETYSAQIDQLKQHYGGQG